MANSGAKKELEGYSSAFAVRDELKAQEKEAERRRTESREQRRSALRALSMAGPEAGGGSRAMRWFIEESIGRAVVYCVVFIAVLVLLKVTFG
jgi:hypothetical protein